MIFAAVFEFAGAVAVGVFVYERSAKHVLSLQSTICNTLINIEQEPELQSKSA